MKKTVNITKEETFSLVNYFSEFKEKASKGYVEFVVRNKNVMKEEFEIIEQVTGLNDAEKEYLKQEYEIMQKYSVNDAALAQGQVVVKKDRIDDYNKDSKKLTDANTEVIAAINDKQKARTDLFKESLDFDLLTVKYADIPAEIEGEIYDTFEKIGLVEYED